MGQAFDICHAHDWLAAKAIVQAKRQVVMHSCMILPTILFNCYLLSSPIFGP